MDKPVLDLLKLSFSVLHPVDVFQYEDELRGDYYELTDDQQEVFEKHLSRWMNDITRLSDRHIQDLANPSVEPNCK